MTEVTPRRLDALEAAPLRARMRAELPTWVALAVPSAITIMANCAAGLTDVSVLGHLDHDARYPNATSTEFLSAVSLATSCIFAMNVFIFAGFASAISVLCSQAFGAGNPRRAARFFYAGVVLSLCAAVPIGVGQFFIPELVRFLLPHNTTPLRHALIREFSHLFLFRLPIWTVDCCVIQFLRSANVVTFPLIVGVCGVLFNVGANVVFVYGVDFGGGTVGGWGFAGSPMATVATEHVKAVALILYLFFGAGSEHHISARAALREQWRCLICGSGGSRRQVLINSERDDHDETTTKLTCGRIHALYLQQAFPLALGGVFEEWQIQVIGFMAGALGGVSLAANNGLMNVFVTLSALNYGIMSATTVRVGFFLGEGSPRKARAVTALAGWISLGVGALISCTLVLLREDLGKIFSSDPEVWRLTSTLCWLVGPTYICLCVFFVCVASLQGQGRPLALAASFAVGAWGVSVPSSWYFAFGGPDWGLWGVWLGLVLGYSVITAMCLFFTCRSDWAAIAQEAVKRGGKKQEDSNSTLQDPLL